MKLGGPQIRSGLYGGERKLSNCFCWEYNCSHPAGTELSW